MPESTLHPDAPPPRSGYEIVADLLDRQEIVLTQLDELNLRVEEMIESINRQRQKDSVDQADELAEKKQLADAA